MHRIEKIVVRGFRGQVRPIELNLAPTANFLIGRNGTGKTTFINLLHAALSMDLATLRDAAFEKLEFTFKKQRSRIKPRFSVSKLADDDGATKICYKVATSATANPSEYTFSRSKRRSPLITAGAHFEGRAHYGALLRDELSSIYRTTWLSLQRGGDSINSEEEWESDSRPDIDRKLDRISNDLTRYFSRLDRSASEKTQQYQKEWFLSFLANERPIRERDIDRIDENGEREALTSIFQDFKLEPSTYGRQLDRHFKLAKKARSVFKENSPVPAKDYLIAVDVLRLHSLVEQWQELESERENIYEPRREFEDIASGMLFKKRLFTNRSNQIVLVNNVDEQVPLDKLSSGEKQLLIFLSETLLQEQKPYIFLADEPELSMHVEWQEELVPALLKINPNAQVLFATHSPDVISVYQNNVFRMEELAD